MLVRLSSICVENIAAAAPIHCHDHASTFGTAEYIVNRLSFIANQRQTAEFSFDVEFEVHPGKNCIETNPMALEASTCAVAWADLLLQEGACSSMDEATVIADLILHEMNEQEHHRSNVMIQSPPAEGRRHWLSSLENSLEENLDLASREEAHKLALLLWHRRRGMEDDDSRNSQDTDGQPAGDSSDEDEHESSSYGTKTIVNADNEEADDDGTALLFDGECELCDRYIQLTKHHLIPKSTWPRLEPLLLHASEALERGAPAKAMLVLGPGLLHLLEDLQCATTTAAAGGGGGSENHKHSIRQILYRTCDICRPCHSAIHKAHDNMDLALHYSTIDRILEDQDMAKFCRWASRQRVGRYAVVNKKKNNLR